MSEQAGSAATGNGAGEIEDRCLAAYWGLACGDALGATVEFMSPAQIRARFGVHRNITGGGWLRLRPGQVTDDTEMSLALGQAMIAGGGWNLPAVADAFADWLKSKPVDVGNTCRNGIRRYMTQGSLSAEPDEYGAGNGACMRNLPVILATLESPADFREWTLQQCHITHHHPGSDAATLALGDMVRCLVLGGTREDCRILADGLVAAHPEFRFDPYPGAAGGYIVDTVQTVLHHFFATDSFESCVVETVNRGEDADTTGAIAGMLAGACYGLAAIPERWLERLETGCVKAIREQTLALLRLGRHRPLP